MKNNKLKIYFLLHAKAFLPSWKSFLETCQRNEDIITKVIYCPVKKAAPGKDGQFDDVEKWLCEQEIDYIHIKKINLFFDKPDLLIIQTPYDYLHRKKKNQTNFYKKLGINMAYITYGLEFTEAPGNIRCHFRLPIYSNCWRVYVFSKDIVEDYAKYCPIGNSHVRCFGHPKFDALFKAKKIKMPDWLNEKINGRKIVCWHPHFPCDYSTQDGKIMLSTFSWEENKKILEYIKRDKETFYIFMAHHMFFGAFEHDYNIPKEELDEFKNDLINGENSAVWVGEYPEVLNWSDIFLGERSAVTMEAIVTNKPVIYLENCPEVYNKFGKDVIDSYYYATNSQIALEYLEKDKKGIDPKKEQRRKVFEKYILPYWDGECGKRILEDILNNKEEILKSRKTKPLKLLLVLIKAYILDAIFSIETVERIDVTHKIYNICGLKIKQKIKCEVPYA